tara:strand:+ start:57 stop:284 length:228 start_codon:yes stop_codon:yes gene_type:complete
LIPRFSFDVEDKVIHYKENGFFKPMYYIETAFRLYDMLQKTFVLTIKKEILFDGTKQPRGDHRSFNSFRQLWLFE